MKEKLFMIGLATLVACTYKNDCPNSTYEITVGSIENICQMRTTNSWGHVISYTGMPSEKVFSVGYFNNNYFFPVDAKEFTLGSQSNRFSVESVSPEKIKFTYIGDKN